MSLIADYDEMQRIAKQISKEAENYINNVKEVYNIVDSLKDVWEGSDSVSYTSKVNEYKDSMEALGRIVNNYAIFLEKAASNLLSVQSGIASSASKL